MIYIGNTAYQQKVKKQIELGKFDIVITNYHDALHFNFENDSYGNRCAVVDHTCDLYPEYRDWYNDKQVEVYDNKIFFSGHHILNNSFKINAHASSGSFSFGNAIASKLEFTSFYKTNKIAKGDKVYVYYVVPIPSDYLAFVTVGIYIVDEIICSKYNYRYTCYDLMTEFDTTFETDDLYDYMESLNNITHKIRGFFEWLQSKGYPVNINNGVFEPDANFFKNNYEEYYQAGQPVLDNWLTANGCSEQYDSSINGGIPYTIRQLIQMIGTVMGLNFFMNEFGELCHNLEDNVGTINVTRATAFSYSVGNTISLYGLRYVDDVKNYVSDDPSEIGNGGYSIISSCKMLDNISLERITALFAGTTVPHAIGIYNQIQQTYNSMMITDLDLRILPSPLIQARDNVLFTDEDNNTFRGLITSVEEILHGGTHIMCQVDKSMYDIEKINKQVLSDNQVNAIQLIVNNAQ